MYELATLVATSTVLLADTAEAFLTWNPTTFYAACAVVQTPIIWLGYRFLGAEPEYNTWPAALSTAAIGNVVAFVLRDLGVGGAIATFLIYFSLLLITSGFDVFRTLLVFFIAMGSYAGAVEFVEPRTPLDAYAINGVPKVLVTGGFKPEPIKQKKDIDTEVDPTED